MQGVTNHISILDDCVDIFARLSIDRDLACFNGVLVVHPCAVAEFGCENVEDFSTSPTFFAKSVVGKMIWRDATETLG